MTSATPPTSVATLRAITSGMINIAMGRKMTVVEILAMIDIPLSKIEWTIATGLTIATGIAIAMIFAKARAMVVPTQALSSGPAVQALTRVFMTHAAVQDRGAIRQLGTIQRQHHGEKHGVMHAMKEM